MISRETERNWEELASAAGMRLPIHRTALTTARMAQSLRRCGLSVTQFLRWGNYKKSSDFIALNPTWTARQFAGLVLEHREQM